MSAPAGSSAAPVLTRSGAKGAAAASVSDAITKPMDLSDDSADADAAAAAAAERAKLAAATKAAAAYMADQLSTLKGRYSDMHSSSQVLLLKDDELWDTMAANWCKPGGEKLRGFVASWEGMDLAACVYRLGLPVLYPKKGYVQTMRRSIVDAVEAHAARHPELFEAEEHQDSGDGSEVEVMQEDDDSDDEAPATPPPAASAKPPAAVSASPSKSNRRSPRTNASSRSAAAAAVAALNAFVPPKSARTAPVSPSI
jgi:hypothetical protein